MASRYSRLLTLAEIIRVSKTFGYFSVLQKKYPGLSWDSDLVQTSGVVFHLQLSRACLRRLLCLEIDLTSYSTARAVLFQDLCQAHRPHWVMSVLRQNQVHLQDILHPIRHTSREHQHKNIRGLHLPYSLLLVVTLRRNFP